ncbi:hypothetical protein BDN72DRAFT_904614, partial [Pluteus cervinus]
GIKAAKAALERATAAVKRVRAQVATAKEANGDVADLIPGGTSSNTGVGVVESSNSTEALTPEPTSPAGPINVLGAGPTEVLTSVPINTPTSPACPINTPGAGPTEAPTPVPIDTPTSGPTDASTTPGPMEIPTSILMDVPTSGLLDTPTSGLTDGPTSGSAVHASDAAGIEISIPTNISNTTPTAADTAMAGPVDVTVSHVSDASMGGSTDIDAEKADVTVTVTVTKAASTLCLGLNPTPASPASQAAVTSNDDLVDVNIDLVEAGLVKKAAACGQKRVRFDDDGESEIDDQSDEEDPSSGRKKIKDDSGIIRDGVGGEERLGVVSFSK